MPTEKLFYTDPYLKEFTASVLSCTKIKNGWAVELDRTAFYPEGGGQPGDKGTLNGVVVSDTHEKDGIVFHHCVEPLNVGTVILGAIDWDHRFDLMQQHSGEHITSGIICRLFHCDNVGFHLGTEMVVIDFNTQISMDQLAEVEKLANKVIWENRPFNISRPTSEEMKQISYRSKKELVGQVRIVECPGADCCACCGTHVRNAGEIGLIKLLSVKPFRDGVRIEMLSGSRAYKYVCMSTEQNRQISITLSAKMEETATAVYRMKEELASIKYCMIGYENRIFEEKAINYSNKGNVLIFEDKLSPDALRRFCDAVGNVCGGRCAIFSGTDDVGYKYAINDRKEDVRRFAKTMNETLVGRGGGKADFVQGSVMANRKAIEVFFENNQGDI